MDTTPSIQGGDDSKTISGKPPGPSRKRSISGGGGLLSKLPFMRSATEHRHSMSRPSPDDAEPFTPSPSDTALSSNQHLHDSASLSMSQVVLKQQQQQKTRRRRGSLRKVALLGRGAQRERRESRSASTDIKQAIAHSIMGDVGDPFHSGHENKKLSQPTNVDVEEYGLGISDITPRPSMDGFAGRPTAAIGAPLSERSIALALETSPVRDPRTIQQQGRDAELMATSPVIGYSTTDDEDALHMGPRPATPSMSSSSRPIGLGVSDVPTSTLASIQRRRSATTQRPKSPLALSSLAGLSTTPLPAPDGDWDYSETAWWGWVVLVVTWLVFVTGMGSCLGVWSWAWDVGTTPYAPPELEDDPTLPIVGYYPALIILTGVMAWVWVVVAWVGMKYFRHARVSGD